MTIDEMKRGISRIRNPVIARAFRELDLIEQWGSGVKSIFEEAKKQGLLEPQIEEIGMRVRFTVSLAKAIPTPLPEQGARSGVESPTQSPTQSDDPLMRLLHALQVEPLSSSMIMKQLQLKHKANFKENYLKPALAKGYIEPTIPDKPNSRLQKYRSTASGRELFIPIRKDK